MGNAFQVLALSVLFLCFLQGNRVLAAGAMMGVNPHSGAYGKPFTVSLVIDGQGEKFNAAEATITLPSGLAVKDLILGDCNFSFLKTPSVQNPSFSGVILGSYTTKCTVYTLSLVPIAKGEATITLAKAKILRYGDAKSILSTATGGSYTLTAVLRAPGVPTLQVSQSGLYTASITVLAAGKTVPNATVTLADVATKTTHEKATDTAGKVQFTNLQAGVYDAIVSKNKQKVGESIINIGGENPVLTFSLNLAEQKKNPLLKNSGSVLGTATASPYVFAGILVLGVSLGTGLSVLLLKWKWRRNASPNTRL